MALNRTSPTSSVRMTSLLVRTPVERRVSAVECAAMTLKPAAGIGKYSQTPPRYLRADQRLRLLSGTDNKEDRGGHA